MIRKSIMVFLLTILFVMVTVRHTAKADTVTYFISVTIPAIPGFNVPPFDNPSARAQHTLNYAEHGFDLLEEEVVRDNQTVLLKTLVPR
ncbi:MAG: hypothetical protein AB7S78_03625 [Candidatus Omnitrophota bacterium]